MDEKFNGLAADDTQYSIDSPEVKEYLNIFPDVTPEAAVGSVIEIHNNVAAGEDIASDKVESVIDMIKEKLAKPVETGEEANDAVGEADGEAGKPEGEATEGTEAASDVASTPGEKAE